eukprot:1188327-Prorocentrum_minimum.AAC.1
MGVEGILAALRCSEAARTYGHNVAQGTKQRVPYPLTSVICEGDSLIVEFPAARVAPLGWRLVRICWRVAAESRGSSRRVERESKGVERESKGIREAAAGESKGSRKESKGSRTGVGR